MQERHSDRKLYFIEQNSVTEKYVIPYINGIVPVNSKLVVAEIGCGEAGNLKPFLDMGCKVIGIDIAAHKIENARQYYTDHPFNKNLTLIAANIYDVRPDAMEKLDLIIMRDTIEHIPHQELFMAHLKKFLKPSGKIFFAFPPWRMPFGGHHQICESRLSKLPYFHLLPKPLFVMMMKMFGESENRITGLLEIRDTGISINRFKRIVKGNNFNIEKEDFYLINPNYEIKFKLKVRKLPGIMRIPYLRDFFTTTYYCIVGI